MALPLLLPIAQGLISIAPSIAKWFGGDNAEDAAKEVIGIAQDITGINNPKDAVNEIIKDESLRVQFLQTLENNRTRIEMSIIEDKQNARREHKSSFMPAMLSVALTLIIAAIVYCLFVMEPPEGSREVLYMLLGGAVREWSGSMQYWFGTTRSSQEKTRMIG